MRILKVLTQNRRDFTADLVCEHCDHVQPLKSGYDDDHYHGKVIPAIKCGACGKTAGADYRPFKTRYTQDEVI